MNIELKEIDKCQFLIGKVQHIKQYIGMNEFSSWNVCQFLIGKVQRKNDKGKRNGNQKVSIPHRQGTTVRECAINMIVSMLDYNCVNSS